MDNPLPRIIQGGMGLGVSHWKLARAVSLSGALGVVSLAAAPMIVARTLQDGDPGGHFRRAFAEFPLQHIAKEVLKKYFLEGGRKGAPYRTMPTASLHPGPKLEELAVITAWAQIWLAKEGHDGPIGVNLLEKIQMTHPATVFGAMLAGADAFLVGAGIPDQFPAMISGLMRWERVAYRVAVRDSDGDEYSLPFDPNVSFASLKRPLKRPFFLAIISSALLATFLAGDGTGDRVDGFVVELPTAGGHNAPPRGKVKLNERGEPIYGPRDAVDFAKIRALGLPFWCAGSFTKPEAVKQALDYGAFGIQAGGIFALSDDSGFRPELRREARRQAFLGALDVLTSPRGSPSGYPFKMARIPGTMSDPEVYAARERVCNIGGFKEPALLKDADGKSRIVYRCPAEPVDNFVRLGGDPAETVDRMCLCNSLMSVVDLAQSYKDGYVEPALMTMGDNTDFARELMRDENDGWTAADAVQYLEKLFPDARAEASSSTEPG